MSCWKPGSVSSSVRTAPPGASAASSTSTERPASASRIAAASPFGPGADDDGVGHAAIFGELVQHAQRASSPWPQNACWASLPGAL